MSSPAPSPEDRQNFLNICLLEGDSDVEKRSRRGKRRALIISVVLQILFVAALILLPLLGKSENIAARVLIYPHVPYSPAHPRSIEHQRSVPHPHVVSGFFEPHYIPNHIIERDPTPPAPEPLVGSTEASRFSSGNDGNRAGIPFVDSTPGPKRPVVDETTHPVKLPPVKVSGPIQEAKLINHLQPAYPPLAVQLHREGRVELHAIIATDGSIQSLEVLSGDPLLIQSALTAVGQWHYRPTTLNGQPVEVDTHITVIYTLSH